MNYLLLIEIERDDLIVHRFFRSKIVKKKIVKKRRYIKHINRKKAILLDDCKCRNCGKSVHPESNNGDGAHHIIYRSEYTDDHLYNLITLCFTCHRFAHDGTKDEKGNRITAREFVLSLLEDLQDSKSFRWQESLELLRRKRK